MEAGLLFYRAHRTALCQSTAEKRLAPLGFSLPKAAACAGPDALCRSISALLGRVKMLLIISDTHGGRPLCAKTVFSALHVPLLPNGEPSHVCMLNGGATRGYLLESRTQAIAILPDLPEELDSILFEAEERIALKFERDLPPRPDPIDYKALVEHSFDHVK